MNAAQNLVSTHIPQAIQDLLAPILGNNSSEWPIFQVDSVLSPHRHKFPDAGIYLLYDLDQRMAVIASRSLEFNHKRGRSSWCADHEIFIFTTGSALNHYNEDLESTHPEAQKLIKRYRIESSFVVLESYLKARNQLNALNQEPSAETANSLFLTRYYRYERQQQLFDRVRDQVDMIESAQFVSKSKEGEKSPERLS